MNTVKLSAIILTLNEELNIERCINSVLPVADEILVVDSFSTDNTELLSKKLGARFIQNPFVGFIEQISLATKNATYDHILIIDADEEVSSELQHSIIQAKENWRFDCYAFNRLANYCGQWIHHCGWYPDRKLRLIDRRRGSWGGENPHHKFILSPSSPVGQLKGDLYHYAFTSIGEHVVTSNRYSEVAAKEIIKKDKRVFLFIHVILNPAFTFWSKYLFKSGFRDGYYGFIICTISAYANFLKYSKALMMKRAGTT